MTRYDGARRRRTLTPVHSLASKLPRTMREHKNICKSRLASSKMLGTPMAKRPPYCCIVVASLS